MTEDKLNDLAVLSIGSFSSLKRIKNYLRSVMTEDKLNDLAVLSIDEFSRLKAHRKAF